MLELDAIRLALRTYSQPLGSPDRGKFSLPAGALNVIKVAAGDSATIKAIIDELGHDEKTLQEAASFYLQRQLVAATSAPLRRLCLPEQATLEEIVLHKRWLLKWLHPDRNPNKWQSAMFNSVTAAANDASAAMQARRADPEIVVPVHLSADNPAASAKTATYRHYSASKTRRKRVRVILWREVLWRIARRAGVVIVVVSLVYLGVAQFSADNKWSSASYGFWIK